MAKDPAFLFYYDRFQSGTMTMSDAEVGQYIRLMCVQANKGFVTEKDVLHICKTLVNEVMLKFNRLPDGNYVNLVLVEIMAQRAKFTESRRNNRKGAKSITSEEHMNKTSDTSVPLVVNVNKDVNKELIEIGVKNEKSISIRPKYAGEVPRRIYDLTEYFKLTGQLEEVNRAGWSVNFGAFMDANPAGVFDDDRHLYNALKTFRGVNGKAKAFEL